MPLVVRRAGFLLVAVALLAGAGLRFLPGGEPEARPAPDPAALAREFGMPGRAWPLDAPGATLTGLRFVVNDAGRGLPCIAYSGGGHGGGGCFRAIGDHGGWAIEAEVMETNDGVVLYGVAVPETETVRVGAGRSAPLVEPGPTREPFGVRYFAAPIPRVALRVHRNDIVALDAQGRLLGRQHYNDGHDRFGRRDGRWERRFDRTH